MDVVEIEDDWWMGYYVYQVCWRDVVILINGD